MPTNKRPGTFRLELAVDSPSLGAAMERLIGLPGVRVVSQDLISAQRRNKTVEEPARAAPGTAVAALLGHIGEHKKGSIIKTAELTAITRQNGVSTSRVHSALNAAKDQKLIRRKGPGVYVRI
jgi:hypothetical protein